MGRKKSLSNKMKVRGWGGGGRVLKEKKQQDKKPGVCSSLCPQNTEDESKTLRRVSSEELDKLEPGGKGNDEENILKLELQRGGRAKIQVGKDCRGQSKNKINYPWTSG